MVILYYLNEECDKTGRRWRKTYAVKRSVNRFTYELESASAFYVALKFHFVKQKDLCSYSVFMSI